MDEGRIKLLGGIYTKIDRGEPITREERTEILAERCNKLREKILNAMKKERAEDDAAVRYTQGTHNAMSEAISLLIVEMHLISGAHAEKRQELEQRVLHLEEEVRSLREPAAVRGPRLVNDQVSAGRSA